MMSTATRSSRYPFTASQWQELEHQALIYKYMVSGMPVPPDLLYTVRRSLDSSLSSKLILHQPHHIGWNCFQMGFGKKIDPEPGRCRRTDGKKWRCSKEAYPDSKYCERHMHRGRNRSRKPVEISNTTSRPMVTAAPPTAIPISSSITNNCSPTTTTPFPNYLTSSPDQPHQYSFLYPHSSSSTDHTTKFLFDSRNSYGDGMKEEVDEHVFFSEASSGTMRSNSSVEDSTWQLAPLTMGSPMKQRTYSSYLQLQSFNDSSRHQLESTEDQHHHQPKKVMHHFFDEWPPKDNKDSWLDDSEDKFSSHSSKTQLSISIPNPSQDFFINRCEK